MSDQNETAREPPKSPGTFVIEQLSHKALGASTLATTIERVFWATAGTSQFQDDAQRSAYFERWLGQYLRLCPDGMYVACSGREAVGYLAGCAKTFSAQARSIAASLGYYTPEVREAARSAPAHFHVNISPEWQGRGLGRALVGCFADECRARGMHGLHVITASGSRAGAFYLSCGFSPRLDFTSEGRRLTLYAMSL